MSATICGLPLEVRHEERWEPRWCFGCRKRLAGTLTMLAPSLDTLMATEAWGWADPVWMYRCDGCGEDRRLGFGMEWVYEDE